MSPSVGLANSCNPSCRRFSGAFVTLIALALMHGCAVGSTRDSKHPLEVLDSGANPIDDGSCSSSECAGNDAGPLEGQDGEVAEAADPDASPPGDCPEDPDKTEPGACGCGTADSDADGDEVPDCQDLCPLDSNKTSPGVCDCGVGDEDRDGDHIVDCQESCPEDPNKIAPGACGCGTADALDGDLLVCSCASGLQSINGECVAKCGDGLVAPNEQCDDGNGLDTDDCTNACKRARCGDGIVWNGGVGAELCDDANDSNSDGCVLCKPAACGDGWVRSGVEVCDGSGDGKGGETLACAANCTRTFCGDGKINGVDEKCDGDGRGQGGETSVCDADCSLPACGDGVVNVRAGEYCDHGGTPTKACDFTCHVESVLLGSETSTVLVDDSYINGTERKRPCPSGYVARGIFGRSGDQIDVVGVVCQAVDGRFNVLKDTSVTATVGASLGGVESGRLMCPGDEFLVGVNVRVDSRIRAIEGLCRPGSEIRADLSQTSGTHSVTTLGTATATSNSTMLTCPDGSIATGIGGHDGEPTKYASSIRLLCRPLQ